MPRAVQKRPPRGSLDYEQGQDQRKISIGRYHILCALLKKHYTVHKTQKPPFRPNDVDAPTGDIVAVQRGLKDNYFNVIIDLAPYEPRRETAEYVPLHYLEDGSVPRTVLAEYVDWLGNNWKMQEAGVLYALVQWEEFLNILSNWHSPHGTTGNPEWDVLFGRLVKEGYPKGIIPCMFFGRPSGCLDAACPFLHDRTAALTARAHVLAKRRRTFDARRHTDAQRESRRLCLLAQASQGNMDVVNELIAAGWAEKEMQEDIAYCANPACGRPWRRGMAECPLRACGRCKVAMYCSTACQKTDWKRHKKEPCATIEEMVEDDELWNTRGDRKGTRRYGVVWS